MALETGRQFHIPYGVNDLGRAQEAGVKKSWWKTALLYGIGIVALVYVIATNWESKGDAPGLKDALSRPIRFVPFAIAAVFCVTNVFLTFVRWYLLVRAQDLPFTLRNAVRLGLVGYFFNTFLPGAVGGDLLKAAFIAREQERQTIAVATVMVDRGIGLWALIVLVALSGSGFWLFDASLINDQPYLRHTVSIALGLLAATLALWGLLGVLPERRAQRFMKRLLWLPRIGHTLAELWRAVWLYRLKGNTVLIALGMSLVGHTCSVLMFYFVVTAFVPEGATKAMPGLREHFLIVPVGMIAQGFFPAPGGVGGGEFVFGWLYEVLGYPQTNGILGSLGQRMLAWALGAVGFVVYAFMKRELPKKIV